jgi:hypothetical protein
MKKNFIHFMHPRIQRFHSNGQFDRTGTYGGSGVAKLLRATGRSLPCPMAFCDIPGIPCPTCSQCSAKFPNVVC